MSADPSLTPPPSLPPFEQLVLIVTGLIGLLVGMFKFLTSFTKRRNGRPVHQEPEIDIEAILKEAATLGAIHATVEATKERLEAGLIEIKHLRERADGFQETIRKTRLDEQ